MKQIALRSVAHSLAADTGALAELREVFDSLDTSRSGRISHAAMVQVSDQRVKGSLVRVPTFPMSTLNTPLTPSGYG